MFHYSMNSPLSPFSGLDIHWRKEDMLNYTPTNYKKVVESRGLWRPMPLEAVSPLRPPNRATERSPQGRKTHQPPGCRPLTPCGSNTLRR